MKLYFLCIYNKLLFYVTNCICSRTQREIKIVITQYSGIEIPKQHKTTTKPIIFKGSKAC